MFAAMAPKGEHKKKAPQEKKKKEEVVGSAAAAAPKKGAPQEPQEQGLGRGFRPVEVKKNKRTKPKEKPQETNESGGQSLGWAGVAKQAPAPKPAPKKWKGPVGAVVITEEELRAQRKAALALRKHCAKQVTRPTKGDDVEFVSLEDVAAAEAAKEAENDTKKNKRDVQRVTAPKDTSKPAPAAEPPVPLAPSKKQAQKPKPKYQDPANHRPPAHTSVNLHPGKKLTKGETSLDHTHMEDGSVIPKVEFVILNERGDGIPVSEAEVDRVAAMVADNIIKGKKSANVRGGLFITSEGHPFSNGATVDELWLVENWYKGVAAALTTKKTAAAETYWHAPEGKKEAEEGVVQIAPFQDTALTLTHDHKARVSLKTLRVHRKEFTERLVAIGRIILQFIQAVASELKNAPRSDDMLEKWMQPFPKHLEKHLDNLQAAHEAF